MERWLPRKSGATSAFQGPHRRSGGLESQQAKDAIAYGGRRANVLETRAAALNGDSRLLRCWGFLAERMQREGQPFYHVYQRVVGPANVFLIVTPAAAIGEPSMAMGRALGEPVPQSWFDALNRTLVSQTLMTLQTYPELATRQADSPHPAEEFAHVRIRTPAAGQDAAFENWLRNDLAPGLRAARAGDVRFARISNARLTGWPPDSETAVFVGSTMLALPKTDLIRHEVTRPPAPPPLALA